jgi:imidazoleglycerol-phosphate dehydratase
MGYVGYKFNETQILPNNFNMDIQMERIASLVRQTFETDISITLNLDGTGKRDMATGIGFFDHMLTLFAAHGFFDLSVQAIGDLHVDMHHTVEDVGLVLGDAFDKALGDRKGIQRYGHAVVPMDETLTDVTVDLSRRPFLVYQVPGAFPGTDDRFDIGLCKEFFRAFAVHAGMNLHINVRYGENQHHILESMFKAAGRALDSAVRRDGRITDIHSTKGNL